MAKIKKAPKQKFTQWGDPVLSTPTQPVSGSELKSPKFKATARRMFKMIKGIGVGLAANQIGLGKRFAIVVIKLNPLRQNLVPVPPTVLVNPKILRYSKEKQHGWEGCLSGAADRFYIERSAWIDVVYTDGFTGKRVERRAKGFEAIVFQHEIDHLDGRVCGEQVMVRGGKVVPGSIITLDWYVKTKGAPPKNLLNPTIIG